MTSKHLLKTKENEETVQINTTRRYLEWSLHTHKGIVNTHAHKEHPNMVMEYFIRLSRGCAKFGEV